MTVTVETLSKALEQVEDKQAKVVITRSGGTYDIDKIITPGEDEDYFVLVIKGDTDDSDEDTEESDDDEG